MYTNKDPLVKYAFSMITLNLILLRSFCFINVLGYMLFLYLINKNTIEIKYPIAAPTNKINYFL